MQCSMNKKTTGRVQALSGFLRRIFHTRNMIIISHHKVDHVSFSGKQQVTVLVGALCGIVGVSFLSGGYFAAKSAVAEKDAEMATTSRKSARVSEHIHLLEHDLATLAQSADDLGEYHKFIVSQYSESAAAENQVKHADGFSAQENDKLMERLTYLENKVKESKHENERLVSAIRERAGSKISFFEDVIAMTGLDKGKLERETASSGKKNQVNASDAASAATGYKNKAGRGGPFVPVNSSGNNDQQKILANIDRAILLSEIIEQLPLARPIGAAQPMSSFGKRVDPFNGRWSMHTGMDLAGASGSPIFATSSGKVISAGPKADYGNAVCIDHGYGISTLYGHLSKVLVREDERVLKGQQIGVQGSTGRSTGDHLHYEVRINDNPVNPINFLKAGEHVIENKQYD
jgi:murein DD-endopeptidase MepM/ murein hydrolase activator NlpD